MVHLANGCGRCGELLGLVGGEVDLHDLLDAHAADYGRNADHDILLTVLALEVAAARDNAFLVAQHRLHDRSGRSSRGVPSRGAEQSREGRAAHHGVGGNLLQLLLGDELRSGNALDGGFRYEGYHGGVAVTADHHAVHVVDVGACGFGQIAAETRRVERAAHADHAVLGQSRRFEREVGHRVHRVRHDDEDRAGRVRQSLRNNALDDVGVGADQLLASHTRLAGNTRSHDYHVRVGGFLIIVGAAHQLALRVGGGGSLIHVEHLALREALLDVDQNYFVGYVARREHIGAGRAHHAGADYRYF